MPAAFHRRHRSTLAPTMALLAALGLAWGSAQAAQAAPPPLRAPAATEAAAAAAPVGLRLEPLGDSITAGVQSSTGNGYRAPLYGELATEGHPLDFVGSLQGGSMADPDNEGHSGWRIDQIAGIIDSSLATYKPNVITLMIGTNDLNQQYQVSTAPARLSSLVDQIVKDDPTATLLVAGLIVSTSSPVVSAEPAYNAAIVKMVQTDQTAGKHVAYVDMSALTASDLADSLHPNDGGYQKMADAWNKAVQAAAAAGEISAPSGGLTAGPVRSGIAGKCLDDKAGSTTNGSAAQLWTCNNTAAQSWAADSDGTLRAVGKCLDANAKGTANGTKLQLWDCNGGTNQVWQAYNGGYRNPVSGRCLDDNAASTTDGTQLQLWDCNGTIAQLWTAPGA